MIETAAMAWIQTSPIIDSSHFNDVLAEAI